MERWRERERGGREREKCEVYFNQRDITIAL